VIRSRHRVRVAALLAPVALFPLFLRPQLALGAAAAAIVALLAWRSVVYPVVIVGLVPVVLGLLGSNPLPQGAVSVLFFAWTALAIGFAILRDDAVPSKVLRTLPVVVTIALAAYMILRLGSSPDEKYGGIKIQLFVSSNVVLLFAGIIIGRDRKHLDLFLTLTVFVAFASAIVLIQKLLGGQAKEALPDRFAINPLENPIFLGRSAADGLIVAIYLLLAGTVLRSRVYAFAAMPALALALAAAGSRGPVVGVICGITALLVCLVRTSRSRRRIPALVVALVAAVILASQLVPGEAIQRSFSFLSGSGSGVSTNGRSDLWGIAIESIKHKPLLGVGTGGYAGITPEAQYPHNLLLETFAELGIIGLLMVLGILASTFARLKQAWGQLPEEQRGGVAVVTALFVAAVVNSMLSGDITVNGTVWTIAGLALGVSYDSKRRVDLAFRRT
jgi:O-antigen ligase